MKTEGQRKGRNDQTDGPRKRNRGPVEEHFGQRQAVDERERRAQGKRAAAAARDLHEAKAPSAPLRDVFLQAFRSEPIGQRLVQIGCEKALLLEPQAQEIVLGHRIRRKAADLHQRRHPDDRRRAAAECGGPRVLGGEHDVEEEALLVGPEFGRAEIDLNGVGIDEMLRRLHDANPGIAKQRHGAFQELRGGHEIGVEDRDEFGRIGQRSDMFQRVVDVSSLGVRIV